MPKQKGKKRKPPKEREETPPWDPADAEEIAPRDLLHDSTYLRLLLRATWEMLPEDPGEVLDGDDEEVADLVARVTAIMKEEEQRGYYEDPDEDEDEDDGTEDDDGEESDDDDDDD